MAMKIIDIYKNMKYDNISYAKYIQLASEVNIFVNVNDLHFLSHSMWIKTIFLSSENDLGHFLRITTMSRDYSITIPGNVIKYKMAH